MGRTGSMGPSVLFLSLLVVPFSLTSTLHCHLRPALALWVVFAITRWSLGDPGVFWDSIVSGIIGGWFANKKLIGLLIDAWTSLKSLEIRGFTWASPLANLISAVALSALLGISLFYRKRAAEALKDGDGAALCRAASVEKSGYPTTRIFPCRTTHARVFPKQHSFGYSYLLCGFPITPGIATTKGTDIFQGSDTTLGQWWLSVKAKDYLEPGNGQLGFYQKAKTYLTENGVKDSEWSYAYLVTAPRFFGYAFNPVSFWYIYTADHVLKKMILEVNNTFGERRMYLLDGSCPASPSRSNESEDLAKGRFTDVWMKDFHVSPFNSRKGSYSLKALNPFPDLELTNPRIDNTITLRSSKDHAKIVARAYSTGPSIEPSFMTFWDVAKFVVGWWWVGFVTFPRIIKEAFTLFVKRKLHVWYRPEVLSSSVGRSATPIEISLQKIFRDYLVNVVQDAREPFTVNYYSAISDHRKQVISNVSPHDLTSSEPKRLELRVLTPAFYPRFVHYAHTTEAFDRECLFTDEKNRTVSISQPSLLPLLLPRTSAKAENSTSLSKLNTLSELRWKLLERLRCSPATPAYPAMLSDPPSDSNDIRRLPYSDLDRFVRSEAGCSYAGLYRRALTQLFLAQNFAKGLVGVIGMLDLALRVSFCCLGLHVLAQEARESTWLAKTAWIEADLLSMTQTAFAVCSCHIYGLAKGYS